MGEVEELEWVRRANVAPYLDYLRKNPASRLRGRVIDANSQTIESEGPPCSVGESCEIIDRSGGRHLAEVIGFRGRRVLAMPVEAPQGIRYGDKVVALGTSPGIHVNGELEGRVLNGLGKPLDGAGSIQGSEWPLDGVIPHPMERSPIAHPIQT